MVTTVWAGLSLGALYSLVALGYTITYIGAAVFNFAQASLVMLAVFLAYWGLHLQGLSTVLVVLLGALAVAAVAAVEERLAVRPVRDHEKLLVTTRTHNSHEDSRLNVWVTPKPVRPATSRQPRSTDPRHGGKSLCAQHV